MIDKLKSFFPERIKGPILAALRPRSCPDLELWRGRKKVVIMLSGFYQNLGDMALTHAQKLFIEKTLPDYEVLLFSSTDTYGRMKALKRVVGPEDIITTIGGGNMDDIYPSLENARRYIVRSFPNNPIISFPQTMAFTDTPEGERALRRSARTYGAHRRLTVFAREARSLALMQTNLTNTRVESSPDIVLSLPIEGSDVVRSGVMLSIRNDKEMFLSSEDRAEIVEVVRGKTEDIMFRDTVDIAIEECQPDTFEGSLRKFLDLVRTRRIVVTDRLHAMIFCVITRTPVIVLPNSNHKIKGTYDSWLSGYSLVRYVDSFDRESFHRAFDELWNLDTEDSTRPILDQYFEPLHRVLLEAAGRTQ